MTQNCLKKNMMNKFNERYLIFMELLIRQVVQFAECSEEDALYFVIDILDRMDKVNIRIK